MRRAKILKLVKDRAENRKAATARKPRIGVVPESDLDAMQLLNESKRREVQQKLDRAVSLGWVCEGYIDLVSYGRKIRWEDINLILTNTGINVPPGIGCRIQ